VRAHWFGLFSIDMVRFRCIHSRMMLVLDPIIIEMVLKPGIPLSCSGPGLASTFFTVNVF
jgi:hypothetical protein